MLWLIYTPNSKVHIADICMVLIKPEYIIMSKYNFNETLKSESLLLLLNQPQIFSKRLR